MKLNKILFIILAMGFLRGYSQTAPSGNVDHQSVSNISVSYKQDQNSNSTINVIPQVLVALKDTSVYKIYFKILDPQNGSTVYNVNYQVHSSAVFNQGQKMFEYANGTVFISNAQSLGLKPYLYNIQTEDNSHNLSSIYSTIK
jgi:hypothetical protein